MNDVLVASAQTCVSHNRSVDASQRHLFVERSLDCVKHDQVLDDGTAVTMRGVLATAIGSVTQANIESWNTCYERCLNGPAAAPRPMTGPEQRIWRDFVQSFADGLLQSFQCHIMMVGVEIANGICGGAPCEPMQLAQVYRRSIGTFSASEIGDVCSGVERHLNRLTNQTYSLSCTTSTPWFAAHSSAKLCEVIGDCGRAGPFAVSSQVGLLNDIVWRQVDTASQAERRRTAATIIDGWTSAGGTLTADALITAQKRYEELQASCTPQCALGIAGLTTASSWADVQGALFREWLQFYTIPSNVLPDLHPGCAGARMEKSESKPWTYSEAGNCRAPGRDSSAVCLEFGAPRDTAISAGKFTAKFAP